MIGRLRRTDPLGPVMALASLLVFLLHGFQGQLGRDLALYAYAGQRVADGVAPYVGVMNRAGPLAHLVPGAGVLLGRAFGTDDVLTIRLLMTAISVVAVWAVYVVGRDLFGSRLAGMVGAATLLTFRGFVDIATDGPREKTPMLLLVTLAVWAVLHRRWGVAGVLVALATLTWQPALFLGGAVVLGALLVLPGRELVRGVVRFVVGGLLTSAVFVVVFWVWGALDEFVQGFVLINAHYTHQSTLVDFLRGQPQTFVGGYGPGLVPLLVGLAATLVLAVVRLLGPDRRTAQAGAVIGLGLGTVVSAAWAVLFAFNGWPDAVVLLPSAALGVGGVLFLLARAVGSRPALPVAVLTTVSVLAVALAAYDAGRTSTDVLPKQRAQVRAVLAAAPHGATLVSLSAPEALVLSHRVNPNPYQMYIAGFRDYIDATYPGGLKGFADLVDSEHPTLIAVDHLEWYDFMQPLIDSKYTRIGGAVRFTWYARTDVGHSAIVAMRRAVTATR